jgi:hypothetical protein
MLGAGQGLGVLEDAMRAAPASAGAALLQAVLDQQDDGYAGPHAGCARCGGQAVYAGSRPKAVTTVLGAVTLQRAWYHCAACKRGFAPRDRQLGLLPGGTLSPGLAEMTALAGAEASFARAAGLLAGLAGIRISARTAGRSAEASGAAARAAAADEAAAIRERRIVPLPPAGPVPDMLYVEVDGTGVPVRASETEGRPGKGEDGKAGTREVKLARLFTVSRLDSKGRPATDPGSSTYAFTFDGKDALADLVKAEYLRRGGEHHRQVVALGDGAAWIWTMAGDLYPHATHITDIYHAREHLHDLAACLAFITPTRPSGCKSAAPSPAPATSRPSSTPPAPTPSKAPGPATWKGRSATSSTTSTACATPASAGSACSPDRATSRQPASRSSPSAPSSPACTGQSRARPPSSRCAPSAPADAGTSSGQPTPFSPPGSGQPSDRQQDSDTKAAAPGKIISNKPVVHPVPPVG